MKLIEREPTPEMIEAMRDNGATFTGMFKATYDAAPEIQQEPAAIVDANDDGYWADILPDRSVKVGQPLYAFPPDAQAEIAKRDARIKELEFSWAGCSQQLKDACADLDEVERQRDEQAAEISRLKGVIAKCEVALNWFNEYPLTHEALAAIKEEGL